MATRAQRQAAPGTALVAWWCALIAVVAGVFLASPVAVKPRLDAWMARVPLPTLGDDLPPSHTPPVTQGPMGGVGSTSTVGRGLGILVLVALAAVGLAMLARWWRARPHELDPAALYQVSGVAVAPPPGREALAKAAHVEAMRLREPGSGGDAIVQAWLALEEAGAGAGVTRDPAQTPTEYTQALLHQAGCDPRAVAVILRAYHKVRYGHLPASPTETAAVARAMHQISVELGEW